MEGIEGAKKVAVVGSTGMLGQALCREGRRRGYEVAGLAIDEVEHRVDITEDAALATLLEELRPQLLINTAAITSLACCEANPAAAYLVNARPVAVMAEICSRLGCHFTHVSTDHYFCGDLEALHDENAPVRLVNEYARSKFAGESFALAYTGTLVLRTNIVGFRGSGQPTFAEWAIEALLSGSELTLFSDFFTSSIHVAGFARALFDLLPGRPQGILNLAAREVCSKQSFIEAMAASLGCGTGRARVGSVKSLTDARRAESLGLDVGRAERLLGYRLPSTCEVVEALVEEYGRIKP